MARVRPKAFFSQGCFYNATTKDLLCHFTLWKQTPPFGGIDGSPYIYWYHNVPQAVADAFLDDEENGEYYNYVIRGHYTFTRAG
jgi:hypothetical protein|tara:strand:+ start:638 stop:889 length:252 start_codon:yes stop_codon:yes gene_type:complete